MYRIGIFSKMNRVTVKALRHYDEIGLFKPVFVDETTGYRYYSSSQLPRLHKILALKSLGFSLAEICSTLENDTDMESMIQNLEMRKSLIQEKIDEEELKLSQLQAYLKTLKQEGVYMKYDIILKELPEVIVASMRRTIPSYDSYYEIYPEMGRYMEEQKVECRVPEYCFTIYHDGEHKETDIDVEICEAVVDFAEDSDKVRFKRMKKIESAACTLHKGPYSTIGMAYGAVLEWIEENNYEVVGPPRESYIDGVWNKDSSDDWLTEIQIPVSLK